MSARRSGESGQAVVEFGLILSVLIIVTAGLIDVGVGIYQYNVVSSLARYGARWGAVVGGMCTQLGAVSTSDFCVQNGAVTTSFWSQPGNAPLQGPGVGCPSYTSTPADYYAASAYLGSKGTTISGAIVQHFDSSASSSGFVSGTLTTGFDLSKLKVCIALSSATSTPQQGDWVTVTVFYTYTPALQVLTSQSLQMSATSQYQVE